MSHPVSLNLLQVDCRSGVSACLPYLRSISTHINFLAVMLVAHNFSLPHASAMVFFEPAANELMKSDANTSEFLLVSLSELSGVTSLYRYHHGVDPATGKDLRDSERMQEGIRALISLLLIAVIAPISVVILLFRRKAAVSRKL